VVITVMGRPPEDAFLPRRLGQNRHEELRDAAQAVRPVAEVPVVAGGDAEHPDDVARDEPPDEGPLERHRKHAERSGMDRREACKVRALAQAEGPRAGSGIDSISTTKQNIDNI
jgi:hypothetical protein